MNPNLPPPDQLDQPPSSAEALRSVHTSNLPEIFKQLQISLAVSTYQAGKVILVRNDGATLNTHFRAFGKPMGIAADRSRLTIGGTNTVWYYRNVPAVAPKLEPQGKHDACFLPRRIHVTGDIDIHEMAYDRDDTLWVVNTRFGCLCTLDAEHSFHPRWRPPFVSAYAPEDRCHLNGLALVEGRPKYVTALGETDTAGGWRANKRNGGILMDIETNEILLRGLSMPHSPRSYQDRLWLLESGQGSLALADLKQGTWRTVAQLPGFTRGIDFYGPLAFVGLSQIRETATFSGIPMVERLRELLIHTEQGAGDAIQFARYLPRAAERVGKLILVCTPNLSPLFATLPGIAEIREPGTFQLTEFDTYLPLLSLPYVFGTTLETISAELPYLDVAILRRRRTVALPPLPAPSRLKVGLAWAGSPTHKNDRNRSCPLAEFLPILRIRGIAFYSLQKGERSKDLLQLPPACSVRDLDASIRDYGDTALLLDSLDLLISVDTAVAHLAGALGKPVWLLLPEVPDWRWALEGETTPWYPYMRLFRQTRRGDWVGVITRVVEALAQL